MANDPIPEQNHLVPYPHNPDQFANGEAKARCQLIQQNDERETLLGFVWLPVDPEPGMTMDVKNQFDGAPSSWVILSVIVHHERDPNAHFPAPTHTCIVRKA